MASARLAAFLLVAGSLLTSVPAGAAPLPHSRPAIAPDALIAPVCHRGWHHRSGRPCGYGYGYGYRYGRRPVCRPMAIIAVRATAMARAAAGAMTHGADPCASAGGEGDPRSGGSAAFSQRRVVVVVVTVTPLNDPPRITPATPDEGALKDVLPV